MSFASDVKNEICKQEFGDICCVRAELSGIVGVGAFISNDQIRFKTEKGVVAQRFFALVEKLYGISAEVRVTDGGLFEVAVTGLDALKILRDLKMATTPVRIHKDIIRNECCKAAMVRGVFLGGASVSDPKKSYHSEITTNRFSVCSDIGDLLRHYEIYAKKIVRNGNHVLYIKESEQIENLLAVVGAHNQMLDFLNVKIEKELINNTNRLANCEAANVMKAASAGAVQKNAILKIKNSIGFDSLPPELIQLAEARIADSSVSLSELGAQLGVSKSCVNHRMRKLLSIAEE